MHDILNQLAASGAGSGITVWAVLRLFFKNQDDKHMQHEKGIADAKKAAVRAHSRLDSHLENHH